MTVHIDLNKCKEESILKKSLISISVTTLLITTGIPAAQAQDNLIYVAVDPCRIVDTRSGAGPIAADTSRDFQVSGANLSSQGGTSCVHPRATSGVDPVAVSAYIVAVPTGTSGGGLLTAFPADQADPDDSIATVNFAAGQVIGNTTTATLCENSANCTNGPLGIITHNTEQDVVIDVQGYYYPEQRTCTDDMVAVGPLCVDTYEASLWDAPTGGSSIPVNTCLADGSNCAATGLSPSPIYAQSRSGVIPTANITWYQAVQACANVGKRLPTTAEWQMAASGTPGGANADTVNGCNTNTAGAVATGSSTGGTTECKSNVNAFDMVGNLWEWTTELTDLTVVGGFDFYDLTADALGRILGSSYNSGNSTTQAVAIVGAGPSLANPEVGFRCVK